MREYRDRKANGMSRKRTGFEYRYDDSWIPARISGVSHGLTTKMLDSWSGSGTVAMYSVILKPI